MHFAVLATIAEPAPPVAGIPTTVAPKLWIPFEVNGLQHGLGLWNDFGVAVLSVGLHGRLPPSDARRRRIGRNP